MSFFIREDPLTGRRVIIASVRSRRPHLIREVSEEEPVQCPFCPGNEGLTPQELYSVKGSNGWLVRVIPNKFSAIPHMHDVVVDSPDHKSDIDTIEHLSDLLGTYQKRAHHYYSKEGVRFVSIFRNRGKRAGASIPHPHSQILALPFYPKRFLLEKEKFKESDPLGEILEEELRLQERVIEVSKNFVVLVAYAPSTSYETWIVPKNPIPSFLEEENLQELGDLLKNTVRSIKDFLGEDTPYNIALHSAPPGDRSYRYYVRILPRVQVFGGFEMETEDVIVSVAPEVCAMELRSVKYKGKTD